MLLHQTADPGQRLQTLHYHGQGHWPVLGRHGIANLLRVVLAAHEVQRLVSVFLACTPESLVIEQLGSRNSCFTGMIFKIVITENGQRSFRLRVAREDEQTVTAGWLLRRQVLNSR